MPVSISKFTLAAVFLMLLCEAVFAATAEELLTSAQLALRERKLDEALKFADEAIAADSKLMQAYFLRANIFSRKRQSDKAIADLNKAIELHPTAAAYQSRGVEHFKLGHINESIADFDQYLKLEPAQEPHHWQRGLSYYYAGRFEDGKKQFEIHKSVNPNDVENVAWHFLCTARLLGVEKARATLIEIKHDARVPMMQIFALFAGKATPDDVLAAAKAGDPKPAQLKNHLFYAHLYLGLYYEALGNAEKAREHILKAADEYAEGDYMGDTARVHAAIMRKAK